MTIPRNLSFLATGASASGVLSVPYGGTGVTSMTVGYIPYGNGTGSLSSSSNLFWDGTNNRLGINISSPSYALDVTGTIHSSVSSGNNILLDKVSGAAVTFNVNGNYGAFLGTQAGGGLVIYTANGSGGGLAQVAQVFASGGVSIGNTTDPGATNLSVTGSTTSAVFRTATGSASVPTTAWTTVFTLSTQTDVRQYIVNVNIGSTSAAGTWSAGGIIITDNGTAVLSTKWEGTSCLIRVTGMNIEMFQVSGVTQTGNAVITRIA